MNEIKVTVELCAEDRARLDKIIEGLAGIGKTAEEPDDVQKALAAVLNRDKKPDPVEAPKNAHDEPKASDHPTLDPFPEQPKAEKDEAEANEKPVSTAELQQLVIALCRSGKKPGVIEVVNSYGVQTVSAIPKDKLSEAYAKLKALEG